MRRVIHSTKFQIAKAMRVFSARHKEPRESILKCDNNILDHGGVWLMLVRKVAQENCWSGRNKEEWQMRRHKWLILSCVLVASLGYQLTRVYAVSSMNNKGSVQIKIASGDNLGVKIVRYDAKAHSVFNKLFLQSKSMQLAEPFAMVLSSSGNLAIDSVTVRWAFTDMAGKEVVATGSSDSFLFNHAPVGRPGASLLLLPGGVSISSDLMGGGGIVGAAPNQALIKKLLTSQNVSFSVDSIIFEDGRLVGADLSHVIDSIQGRKKAIDLISSRLNDEIKRKGDPIKMLASLRAETVAVDSRSSFSMWMRRFTGMKEAVSPEFWAEEVKKQNQLPPFYRIDENGEHVSVLGNSPMNTRETK